MEQAGSRLRYLVVAAVVLVATMVAGLALGGPLAAGGDSAADNDLRDRWEKPPRSKHEPHPGFDEIPEVQRDLRKQAREKEERDARRKTPEERERRDRSRTAHTGLGRSDAIELARAKFEKLFSKGDRRLLPLEPGQRVVRYTGETTAVVEGGPGKNGSVVESTLPLRAPDEDGELRPIDLDLEAGAGGWEPANGPLELKFGERANDALTFADDFQVAVGAPATQGSRASNEIFYPEVAPDTDAWFGPVVSGARVAFQLRSEESPEEVRMRIESRPGLELRTTTERKGISSGVEMLRDGKRVGMMSGPVAFDAEGEPVDLSVRVEGSEIVIAVPHRGKDLMYPLAIDPVYENQDSWRYGNSNWAGWVYYESVPQFPHGNYHDCCGWGWWIARNPNQWFHNSHFAEYQYHAPNDQSFIHRADFMHVRHDAWDTNTTQGMWSTRWGGFQHRYTMGYSFNAVNQFWSVCADGQAADWACDEWVNWDQSRGNYVQSSISPNIGGWTYPSWWALMYFGGARIWMSDGADPYNTHFSYPGTHWMHDVPAGPYNGVNQAHVRFDDAGLGIWGLWMDVPGMSRQYSSDWGNCNGARSWRCPSTRWHNFSYSGILEGVQTVTATGQDVINRTNSVSRTLKIDRTIPESMGQSGYLYDRRNGWVKEGTHALSIAPRDRYSGVKSDEAWVDSGAPSTRTNACDVSTQCPTAAPARTWTWDTRGYAEGSHTIYTRATDPLNHPRNESFGIKLDRSGPKITGITGTLARGGSSRRRGPHDLHVDTSDSLSGVQKIEAWVDDADNPNDPRVSIGTQTCATQYGCPTLRGDFSYDSTNGPRRLNVTVTVTDWVTNPTTDSWTLTHDDNPPVLELSGDLRPPLAIGRSLHMKATDNQPDDTGVRKIELWLDPDADPTEAEAEHVHKPDCANGCPGVTETDWALPADTPEGRHTIYVKATDDVGRTDEERYDVHVVSLLPSGRSKLGLEHWFDYDVTETGGDSKLYVNGETGNTVWHGVPVVNPGRGLSSAVNLTYNSHDRGGILGSTLGRVPILDLSGSNLNNDLPGLSYSEAGVGFSLGVSGPTRLNEPLGGVVIAQAVEEGTAIPGFTGTLPAASNLVVTMTDSDGTVHTFTKGADGRWIAPPGVNMRLRRFRDGGNFVQPIEEKWALTRSDGVTHFFDNLGYLTKTKDRNDNVLTYQYEHYDALTGDITKSVANATGQIVDHRLCDGVQIGKNTQVTLPNNTTVPVFCAKRVAKVIDPANREMKFQYYDHNGTFLGLADGQLPVEFRADFPGLIGGRAGRIQKITDHANREYTFEYDDYGYLTKFVEAANRTEKRTTELGYEAWAPGLEQVGQDRQLSSVKETETGRTTTLRHVHPDDRTGLPVPGVVASPRQACGVIKRNTGQTALTSTPVSGQECRTRTSDIEKTYDYTAANDTAPRKFDVDEILMRAAVAGQSATVGRTTHELDTGGRPTAVVDPNGLRTALEWNTGENAISAMEDASGTADESRTELSYDTTNHTGVITEKREYPSHPSTTGARVTRFTHQFSNGTHLAAATSSSDTGQLFVADLTEIQNPTAGTGRSFEIEQRLGLYTGNVTAVWDRPGRTGNVARTTYDAFGRILTEDDEVPGNGITTFDLHHATGQPQKVTDARGKVWDYRYDAVGNLTSVIDPRATVRDGTKGNAFTTTLAYDSFDRLLSEHIPKLSGVAGTPESERFITRSRTFDRNGNVRTATDGAGKVTSIDYTAMDRPQRVTAPGRPARPEVTDYVYDDADRLIARVDPKGTTTALATAGSHHSICTATGTQPPATAHMTRYCLDAGGRMIAEIRSARTADLPNGGPTALIKSFAHDGLGNVVGLVDPLRNQGKTVAAAVTAARDAGAGTQRRFTFEYNRLGQQTNRVEHRTETDAGGARLPALRTQFEYDANGNRETVLPPRAFVGRTSSTPDRTYQTKTFYDHRDLKQAVRTPAGCTAYGRREDGKVTSTTSPRGTAAVAAENCATGAPFTANTTKFTYDNVGDLASRTVPYAAGQYGRADAEFANRSVVYTRNDVGDPTTIKDPAGRQFTNTYYDNGATRSTQRPSWFELDWSGGHETPDPGRHFGQDTDAGDFELADGGPRLREVEDRSRNAQRSDRRPDLPDNDGHGDFARVDRQDHGDLLPDAGTTTFAYDAEMRLKTITDAAGKPRTIGYDEAGRTTSKSWSFKPGDPITHQFAYDPNGNLEQFTDGRSKSTTYGYDGYDRRTSETTPGASSEPGVSFANEVTRLAYDANGNLDWRQTPRGSGHRFDFDYDSLDRLKTESNPAGNVWEYGYDENGNTSFERSPRYRSPGTWQAAQFQRTFTYDAADRMTKDQPGFGSGASDYTYDRDGNVATITTGSAASANGATAQRRKKTFAYDGRGLRWRETTSTASDAERQTTINEYDANGNLRRSVDGKGILDHSVAKVLDSPGTSMSDATWHATVREYDQDDQLTAIWLPWSKAPTATSPAVADPTGPSQAEEGGDDRKLVQRFQRPATANPLKRITSIVSPHETTATVAPRTSYTYFDNGWVASQSDEKLVRPSSTAPVKTAQVTYDYEKTGEQKLWRTDTATSSPNGRLVKRYFYDDGTLRRREAFKPQPDGDLTRRTHDYFYNENRSLVRIVDYDATVSERDSTTPGRSRTTRIIRDAAERETAVDETWSTGRDTDLDYDANSNVTARRTDGEYVDESTFNGDERKVVAFEYDPLDRETKSVVTPVEGSARTTATTWWDANLMRTRTKSNSTVESFFYRPDEHLSEKVRDPAEGATETQSYTYDGDGNRTKDERGDHVFNPRGQLVRWTRGSKYSSADPTKDRDGTVVRYERNPTGDITKKTDSFRTTGVTGDTTTTLRYHGERLLWTETSRPTLAGAQTTHSDYSYDDFGSVTKIVHEQTGPGADPPEPPDGPPSSVSCAEMPSTPEIDVTRYCYDEFARMVQSRGSGITSPTSYVYDGLDRRDRKTVTEAGQTKHHDYSYVGTTELLSRETDKDSKKKTYDYDSDGRRLGQTVKATSLTAPTHRPYAADANGSVEGLEDASGGFGTAGLDTYLYDPYGESENLGLSAETEDPGLSPAAKDNPFRFQGFYFDSGVKTYDMQARSYRPDIGRFLSEDRYEAAVGDQFLQADPLTQNRYAFAGGNPVNNVEFDGHCWVCDKLKQAWRWAKKVLAPIVRPIVNAVRSVVRAVTASAPRPKPKVAPLPATTAWANRLVASIERYAENRQREGDLPQPKSGSWAYDATGSLVYGSDGRPMWMAPSPPAPAAPEVGLDSTWEDLLWVTGPVAGAIRRAGGGILGRIFGRSPKTPPVRAPRMDPIDTWGRRHTLRDHFRRHGPALGSLSERHYARQAADFLADSQWRGLPTKIDSNGVIRVYDRKRNIFGSYNPNGTTRTFYKPDPAKHGRPTNWDYWLDQPGQPPWTP